MTNSAHDCFLQKAEDLLHETQVLAVVQLLHEVVSMVTEDSREAIGSCVSFVSTPSNSPRTLQKTKLTDNSEREKVSLFEASVPGCLSYISFRFCFVCLVLSSFLSLSLLY